MLEATLCEVDIFLPQRLVQHLVFYLTGVLFRFASSVTDLFNVGPVEDGNDGVSEV